VTIRIATAQDKLADSLVLFMNSFIVVLL